MVHQIKGYAYLCTPAWSIATQAVLMYLCTPPSSTHMHMHTTPRSLGHMPLVHTCTCTQKRAGEREQHFAMQSTLASSDTHTHSLLKSGHVDCKTTMLTKSTAYVPHIKQEFFSCSSFLFFSALRSANVSMITPKMRFWKMITMTPRKKVRSYTTLRKKRGSCN